MKSTVQNSIFRNWIRKKWIFVRLKIHFFVFQPYMGERPAEGFRGSPCGMFSRRNSRSISPGALPRERSLRAIRNAGQPCRAVLPLISRRAGHPPAGVFPHQAGRPPDRVQPTLKRNFFTSRSLSTFSI